MVVDPRKRQKKLERKKAKDKARHKSLAARQTQAVSRQFERAGQGRIIDSFVASVLWDEGIGNAVLARDLGGGRVAVAVFLVDIFCLGVKDAFLHFTSLNDYTHNVRERLIRQFEAEKHAPEFIRKLVEDSVAYARFLGLEPHADYEQAKAIFGDIDASACSEQFEFGREGKPFFVSGPHDSAAKCHRIVTALAEHCGVGNFNYLVQMSECDLMASGLNKLRLSE